MCLSSAVVILRDIVAKQLGISVSDQTTPTPQKLESPTTVALATNEEDGSQVSNGICHNYYKLSYYFSD